MYPFGPLPGCAAMITLISHDGTCCIGINTDAAAITDPALFRICLGEGIDEILALRPAPRPATPGPARRPPKKAPSKKAPARKTSRA